jgi:Outer membrane protein beta-barrel domain
MGLALALLTISIPAAAQWSAVEVGVDIGGGCIGDSSGFCGDEMGTTRAAHASAWIDDRLGIGVRLAVLPLEDWNYSQERDSRFDLVNDPAVRTLSGIDVAVRDRSRRILSAEAIYHFTRGRPFRAFLGGGFGQRSDRGVQTCAPAGCELVMPILSSPIGRHARAFSNTTIIAGLSGRLSRRLYLRGGLRLHNIAGEESSTTEWFIGASYRFGR